MTTDDFQNLLLKRLPTAKVKMTAAPSGAFMANIYVGARLYVIEFQPNVGFGVSKCTDDDLLFAGHDIQVQTLEEAITELQNLIAK